MKPAWDKLMNEYKGHAGVVIADVDCTAAGKSLCDVSGVQGFPTIKYGDPNNMEKYAGGRDFDAMSKFAKENLGPSCGPEHLDLCDAAAKKQVEEFLAMPMETLATKVQEKEDESAKADKDLEELLKSLQAQYEAATKAKDKSKEDIKESGLGLMKSVAAHRKKAKAAIGEL
ncbi:unnamed protein product [Polarella glacialis]|uniref:Thioredoxin domain-containing protein n=1 Tax=Polarella glacialis TaxID=89957 RepID=A0A813I7Y1_POLGL|nr:unnamed protein product [Polarella glacialis]CAE8590591.1 unnamed protein product [Polarella glacialis]CAE8646748.1 unnamed protein product [Polarella glacialis]CAE8646750.1 unnamed protein product [Polarella glacialis]CAE8683556.1 unnamed protein product [Polarella glacialis]|mmetsp:Transcript_67805/g.109243  ORF Transcript_67805/g.109243 Transcript_67805/m.109243 type:complete len:172 (+) Transcript_67805:218-733(+)|eukprot:CAMPEP_0115067324 /NCGR_PEP_ID=MMETSP0227-20121206/11324_1 /TAXON_ID=89957 /ORGANISM="Polarella glacialis, Strain CCMP 1383" /LENGTH=171 /DNA_ID=CAMNT_0002453373 /DNA_START=243 /DNA_END=758 /DNA_ORIENTATION=+